MNECIEILNRWAENFSAFAWPMLWQSSLLIAVIFVFDLMFARRIRASIRYAIWMVLLVKLILPPALALPTGATWWLRRPHPVVEPPPVIQNYTVSFGNSLPEATLPAATVPTVEPPPKLSGEAWVLLAVAAMGVGLLSWLTFRWLRVAAKVRTAATAPAELDGILEEARQLTALRRRLRLKLIDDRQSPAVYGLFRPVILLPRTLANQLAGRQLRAVLLHEAMHLRRGDIWVNFAQTLLQIAYWWHPLFWVANARIRRVREEAVDDAVMLALREGADAYAPTLLEVAKFAFRRPLASLGLIGILESRSALRQRVERLVDFQPSRRTGLTLLSLCGIFAFSAVALPMGQGPDSTSSTRSTGPEASAPAITNGVPADVTVTRKTVSSGDTNDLVMRTFKVGTNDFIDNLGEITGSPISASDTNVSAFLKEYFGKAGLDMSPPKSVYFNTRLGGVLFVHATPQDMDVIEHIVEILHDPNGRDSFWLKSIYYGTASGVEPGTVATGHAPKIVYTSANRDAIRRELNQIQLNAVSFHDLPLSEVLRQLRESSIKLDPDKQGINFLFNPHVQSVPSAGIPIDPKTGMPMKSGAAATLVDPTEININLSLNNVSLHDVLNAICLVSGHPIQYSVEDYGIVFSTKGPNAPPYEMRTFKVDPNSFYNSWKNNFPYNGVDPQISESARAYFSKLGVNLDPPKTVFYRDREGLLFVYATPQDLDVIQKAIEALNEPARNLKGATNDPATNSETVEAGTLPSVNGNDLETRAFKIDPNTFYSHLQEAGVTDSNLPRTASALAKEYFEGLGLNLNPPKAVDYDERREILLVKAPPKDMEVIEKAMAVSVEPPQIHVKARFIEVPQKFLSGALAKSMFPGLTNGAILTNPEFQMFWDEAKLQKGSEELAEPEATTLSGRQTQMRATITQPVITNFTFEASAGEMAGTAEPYGRFSDGSRFVPQTTQVEIGPILDVVPDLLADGHNTVNMTTIASHTDFLGYSSSRGLVSNVTTNAAGTGFSPVFQVGEAVLSKNIWDGQTLVLFPRYRILSDGKTKDRISKAVEEKNRDKVEIVLVTATLIDPAGNRIDSDFYDLQAIPAKGP